MRKKGVEIVTLARSPPQRSFRPSLRLFPLQASRSLRLLFRPPLMPILVAIVILKKNFNLTLKQELQPMDAVRLNFERVFNVGAEITLN